MNMPKISFMTAEKFPVYSIPPDRACKSDEELQEAYYFYGWNTAVLGNDCESHPDALMGIYLEGYNDGLRALRDLRTNAENLFGTLTSITDDGIGIYYCDVKQSMYAYHYGWNAAVQGTQMNAMVHDIITIFGDASVEHEVSIAGYLEAAAHVKRMRHGAHVIVGDNTGFERTSVASKVRDRTETSSVTEEIALQRPSEYM